jgi:catechol 2,3-dioxygenase-like lactoylglutathione lyase family enzyme
MKLSFVRLLVDDYGACFRFYRDVMGFPVTFGDEEGAYADFDAGADWGIRVAYVRDPDGNLIELNHAIPEEAA